MREKAVIFYFSGTGTTEIAAVKIAEGLRARGYDARLIKIEDYLKQHMEINMGQYALVGIGCQVIAFGAPSLAMQFVKKLPPGKNVKTFLFRLAAGIAPINFNASNGLRRILQGKGYCVFHERLFSIGSNWAIKFDDHVIRQLYYATMSKIESMCGEIASGRPRALKTGPVLRLLIGFIGYAGRKMIPLFGKDFSVSGSCSHCGKCVRNCPANNIREVNGRIRFGWRCNCCVRCIYSCPNRAIRPKLFSFLVLPGGKYNVRESVESGTGGDIPAGVRKPSFLDGYVNDPES